MTKEEMFKKIMLEGGGYDPNEFIVDYTKTYSLILQAMEDYAKQQDFAFAQWVSHSDWVYLPSKKLWYNEEDEENNTALTTEQLYSLSLEQK